MKQAILAILADGGRLSAAELIERLGAPQRTIRNAITELVDARRLDRFTSPNGAYGPHRYAVPVRSSRRWYPWARAGEYRGAQPTGSTPEGVRRLMAEP